MAKSKLKNWAEGRWLIVSMDQWDEDYLNEEGEAFIELRRTTTANSISGTCMARSTTG